MEEHNPTSMNHVESWFETPEKLQIPVVSIVTDDEQYDPAKHCCPRWYRDFCDCFRGYGKENRAKERAAAKKQVASITQWLEKLKLHVDELPTQNLVTVTSVEGELYYISLRSPVVKVKYRKQGTNTWITETRSVVRAKLLNKPAPKPKPDELVPFGKHKGKTFDEVEATEPNYLNWMLTLNDLKPSTRYAIELAKAPKNVAEADT